MQTYCWRRFNGPNSVTASTTTHTTIIARSLPAGNYVLIAKTVMGLLESELSSARLRLPSDGDLDGDWSEAFPAKTATHFLQRVAILTAKTQVQLVARSRAEWSAGPSSLIAIPVESLSYVDIRPS